MRLHFVHSQYSFVIFYICYILLLKSFFEIRRIFGVEPVNVFKALFKSNLSMISGAITLASEVKVLPNYSIDNDRSTV